MKTLNPLIWVFLVLVPIFTASSVWAEEKASSVPAATETLKAVDKEDALAPGTPAAETIMKDTPAFPLEVAAVVVGEVVSTDPSKNTLTVKEENTGKRHTISAINTDVFEKLQKGDKVRISIPAADQKGPNVFKA